MMIIDYILWAAFITAMVVLVTRFSTSFPKVLDVDVTDPLSVFELEEEEKSNVCPVCERKKGSEPLLICQTEEECINKSETH